MVVMDPTEMVGGLRKRFREHKEKSSRDVEDSIQVKTGEDKVLSPK